MSQLFDSPFLDRVLRADGYRRARSIVRARKRRSGPVLWGQARGCIARRLVPPAHPLADRDRVSCALARFTAGTYDQVSFFDVRSWITAGADVAPAVID